MNIVKDLVARIEKRLTQTKKPCKLFATEERAEAAALEQATFLAGYLSEYSVENPRPARYVVVLIPSINKWAVGLDMTEVMNRPESTGGYLGIMADRGYYTF